MEEHDGSYRKIFSSPLMVKDLLAGFIDEAWVDELNFDSMEPVETSFVTGKLTKRESDVIWRIQWRERWLYVYVLIEMQSSVDPTMAIRLLGYISLLYQDLWKQKLLTPCGHLPPVLPITIYNGKRKWTAETKLSDMVMPVSDGLKRYQPQLEYFVLDEGKLFRDGLMPSENLVSVLVAIENSVTPQEFVENINVLIQCLNLDTPEHRALREAYSALAIESLLPSRFPDVKLPILRDLLEVKNMLADKVMDWTQQWKQEGLEKGLEKGRLEGIEKGKLEGKLEGIEDAHIADARNMLAEGLAVDLISRVTGLSVDKINELRVK